MLTCLVLAKDQYQALRRHAPECQPVEIRRSVYQRDLEARAYACRREIYPCTKRTTTSALIRLRGNAWLGIPEEKRCISGLLVCRLQLQMQPTVGQPLKLNIPTCQLLLTESFPPQWQGVGYKTASASILPRSSIPSLVWELLTL